jgi:hypothetical protein
VAQRLKPEERDKLAREQRLRDAAALEYLYLVYSRINEFFDAAYGGGIYRNGL